jgi:hypothetical protein
VYCSFDMPKSTAETPVAPYVAWRAAKFVVVEVPPLLLVPYEQRTPAQELEFKQCETDFHHAMCRAVHASARSLSANV